MADEAPVLKEKIDNIGIIILNREKEKNTFTPEFAALLNQYLLEMDDDDEIRVIVIKANGKHFSTGIALDQFPGKTHKEYLELIEQLDMHTKTIFRMKKPVIASVKGFAIANGAGLVYACDLAVAAERSKFGTTAINVGLNCIGPAVPLSRHVNRKKLLEMVLTGDMYSAAEMERLGVVNKVVPDDKLEEKTMELAQKLASKSPLALESGKKGIHGMLDLPYEKASDYMREMFASLLSTEDAMEGLDAFTGRRSPVWKRK
jgi:enoyl-CoA hydratase/carnithine racemase